MASPVSQSWGKGQAVALWLGGRGDGLLVFRGSGLSVVLAKTGCCVLKMVACLACLPFHLACMQSACKPTSRPPCWAAAAMMSQACSSPPTWTRKALSQCTAVPSRTLMRCGVRCLLASVGWLLPVGLTACVQPPGAELCSTCQPPARHLPL